MSWGLILKVLSNKFTWIAIVGIICFGYFKYSSNKIEAQNLKITALETEVLVVQSQAASYAEGILYNNKMLAENIQDLKQNQIESLEIIKEVRKRTQIFQDHDLKKLSQKKSGLIEKRVNAATEKVFNEILDETSVFISEIS